MHEASSANVSKKLCEAVHILNNEALIIRLASTGEDARAKDIKYHLSCWVNYVDRLDGEKEFSDVDIASLAVETELLSMIRISIQSGEVLNMRQVLTTYLELISKSNATELRDKKTIKMWLKDRVLNKIPEADYQSPVRKNEPSLILAKRQIPKALHLALKDAQMDKSAEMYNDLDILRKAATIIRNNCIQFQNENKMEFHGTVNIAENNVPSKVLIFHRWVIAGDKAIFESQERANLS